MPARRRAAAAHNLGSIMSETTRDLNPLARTIKRRIIVDRTGKVQALEKVGVMPRGSTPARADTPTRSEPDRDRSEAAQEVLPPGDRRDRKGEAEIGVTAEQRGKGDFALGTGQRRAEAGVDPLAEGDVAVGV